MFDLLQQPVYSGNHNHLPTCDYYVPKRKVDDSAIGPTGFDHRRNVYVFILAQNA